MGVVELEMTRSGFNTWSFKDEETGDLIPQVGDNGEVIVGYQCVDVGKGYWWGQIPSSDVLWCNLFQVDTVNDEDNGTTLVTYHNLAMLAKGACLTDLTMLNPSMKLMQAHFTKQVDTVDLALPSRAMYLLGAQTRYSPLLTPNFRQAFLSLTHLMQVLSKDSNRFEILRALLP